MTPWNDEIDPLPLYRTNPEYPLSMARRVKEGYVIFEFVISNSGFVNDIAVIKSSHASFEKKAKDALKNWRYAPKIDDGKAVASNKQRVRLDFTMG